MELLLQTPRSFRNGTEQELFASASSTRSNRLGQRPDLPRRGERGGCADHQVPDPLTSRRTTSVLKM